MLKLQALMLLCGLFMISCSEDNPEDDINPSVTNAVLYDGTTYQINRGLIEDYGPDNSHYNYDMILTDGTIGDNDVDNETFIFYLELFSAETSGFKTGTFTYVYEEELSEMEAGKSYFTSNSSLYIDVNNDGIVNDDDEEISVTGGTLTISGSGANYTLVYDLTLENGKTLKGGYEGSFTVSDEKEDDDDSTDEEDDQESGSGYFKTGNIKYNVIQGVAHSVSVWEYDSTGRYHEILLMGDGFVIDNNGEYTGEGIWMNLTLVAKEAGKIEGEYKVYADFGAEDDARNAPEFSWKGLEVIEGDPESEDNYTEVFDSDDDRTEMTVKITKIGNTTYEIIMEGADNGNPIELRYLGHLPVYL